MLSINSDCGSNMLMFEVITIASVFVGNKIYLGDFQFQICMVNIE